MISSETILFLVSVIVSIIFLSLGLAIMASAEKSNISDQIDNYVSTICAEMQEKTQSMVLLPHPYCIENFCSYRIIIVKNNSTCSVRI